MKFITDPRFFNYLLIILFALCSIRWAIARSWWDAGYWMAGAFLNVCVTVNK